MTQRRIIHAVEGQPITGLFSSDHSDLNRARSELTARLRPTLPLFTDSPAGVMPTNVVGTVRLSARTVLSITPKVSENDDWVGAGLDLMVPERASVAGHRQAARSSRQRSLESGLATLYRDRLERALRAEGPIEVMHSEFARSGSLDGRLDIERWLLARPMQDYSFPVHRSVLDADNELTAALSLAATILSRATEYGALRSSLVKLSRDIRPGLPDVTAIEPSIIGWPLPRQWARYEEAWSIAQVVLVSAGFTSRHGRLSGVEVALEPWVLLEELLNRTVSEAVRQARQVGLAWHNLRHPEIDFLHPQQPAKGPMTRLLSTRVGKPENLITDSEGPVASFEAKYSRPSGPASIRHHMYQLLTTAAHAGSPCAILVYPELAEPVHWRAANTNTSVTDVYAVGLNLYGYTAQVGVRDRAKALLGLIPAAAQAPALAPP